MAMGSPGHYTPSVGDPSLLGPLTARYTISPNWYKEPVSQSFTLDASIGIQLTYSPIPEPSTGLLVIAGLLCLGGWRRLNA